MRPVTPIGILAAELESLVEQVESMPQSGSSANDQLNPAFKAQLHHAYALANGLDPYLDRCTTPESPALSALVRRTNAEDWTQRFSDGKTVKPLEQEMVSGHVEGQFLKFLIHLTKARRVLEIGVFTGYSALAMAEALPADGQLVACEVDAYAAEFAQKCFAQSSAGHKINLWVAPAIDTMQQLVADGAVFDFVFIDADKGGYQDYLNLLLTTSLLAVDGLICVDNTLMQGQPYLSATATENGMAIAKFNQAVADDPRVEQVLLPLRDGITLIRRV
jgi:caffeoyl-CoA O-methyltransferase